MPNVSPWIHFVTTRYIISAVLVSRAGVGNLKQFPPFISNGERERIGSWWRRRLISWVLGRARDWAEIVIRIRIVDNEVELVVLQCVRFWWLESILVRYIRFFSFENATVCNRCVIKIGEGFGFWMEYQWPRYDWICNVIWLAIMIGCVVSSIIQPSEVTLLYIMHINTCIYFV